MVGRPKGSRDSRPRTRRTRAKKAADEASQRERQQAARNFQPSSSQSRVRSHSAPNVGAPSRTQQQEQRRRQAQAGVAAHQPPQVGDEAGASSDNRNAMEFEVGAEDFAIREGSYHARYLEGIKRELGTTGSNLRKRVANGEFWYCGVGLTSCPIAVTQRTQIRSGLTSGITPEEFYKPRVRFWYEHS